MQIIFSLSVSYCIHIKLLRTHGAHVFTSQYSFWLLRIEFSFLCELKRIEETLGLGDLGNF